jgi:hypothetical protein
MLTIVLVNTLCDSSPKYAWKKIHSVKSANSASEGSVVGMSRSVIVEIPEFLSLSSSQIHINFQQSGKIFFSLEWYK